MDTRQRGCPVHQRDFVPDDCQWCADVLADRPITLARTRAAMGEGGTS